MPRSARAHTTGRRWLALLGPVVGACALLLSACSSSGGGGDGTDTATATTTVTTTTTASASGSSSTDSTPPAPTTSAPEATRCHTSELSLAVGPSQGAAGTVYTDFTLTNTGSRTCDVYGYPGVSYLDAGGNQVGPAATRVDYEGGPELVSIAPGQAAHFAVANSNVVPQPGCPSKVTAPTIQVYPPDETTAMTLGAPAASPFTVCNPRVSPVHPGATSG